MQQKNNFQNQFSGYAVFGKLHGENSVTLATVKMWDTL